MRTCLVLVIAACGSGGHSPDALVCAYGSPCDPSYSCLGIQTANPNAASGPYSDPLVPGREMFCDMRTQPPIAYGDLVVVPAMWSSPGQRVLTAADLQQPVLQQAFVHFYNGGGAVTPVTTFDAADPCVADGGSGAWLTFGGSRVFLRYLGDNDAQSTSFTASLTYRLVLPDLSFPPALDHLPDDFFATYAAASTSSATCTAGTHPAFALNVLAD